MTKVNDIHQLAFNETRGALIKVNDIFLSLSDVLLRLNNLLMFSAQLEDWGWCVKEQYIFNRLNWGLTKGIASFERCLLSRLGRGIA